MSKNGTEKVGMTTCNECGCSLKAENLARHLSKVHKIELKQDEIEKLITESGVDPLIQKNGKLHSPSKNLSNRGLSSGGKKLSKREKRGLTQLRDTNKAEMRKLVLIRRKRRNVVVASIAILALVGFGISYNMFVLKDEDSQKPAAIDLPEIKFGKIVIPKSEIVEDANFYNYYSDETEIRTFSVRGSDGQEHIAFDACDSCYAEKKGYRQEGEDMKCNNCGRTFAINSIGTENTEGGCWPSYVEIDNESEDIVITEDALKEKRYLFE